MEEANAERSGSTVMETLSFILLAIALVQYGLYLLQPPIARLAGLYQSGVDVLSFELREIAIIIGIGIGLGLTVSWFAAARHMRQIEPR